MSDMQEWIFADEHYRFGSCADLAYALSERLGLPMAILVDGPQDSYTTGHAFVLDGGMAIDIRGRRPVQDVYDEWGPELGSDMYLFELTPQDAREIAELWRQEPPDDKRDELWIERLIVCTFCPPHMVAAA